MGLYSSGGNPSSLFDEARRASTTEGEVDEQNGDEDNTDIPEHIFRMIGSHSEDIAHVRSLRLGIDDDNAQSPENIPTIGEAESETQQSWDWDGSCHRENMISLTGTA